MSLDLLNDNELAKETVRNNLMALSLKLSCADDGSFKETIGVLVDRLENRISSSHINEQNGTETEDEESPFYFFVSVINVSPVIQKGPSCGLAALSMSLQMLRTDVKEIEDILNIAKSLNFTKQGEMFSAKNMLKLLNHIADNVRGKIVDNSVSMEMKKKEFMKALYDQHPILVPYDKDFNNEPCNKNGTKAHWALITGFLIPRKSYDNDLLQTFEFDNKRGYILYLKKEDCGDNSYMKINENLFNENNDESLNTFVFAMQGKSLKPQLWSLDKLLDSNNQLNEIDEKILSSAKDCCLPANGIHNELSGKIIILEKS